MKYLQSLRSSDKFSLQLADIGVITPYRKQVCTFISCLRLFPLVDDQKVKKRAGKLTRLPICARKFHGVVVLVFLFVCSFVRSFPLVSFSFARPRRSLREISESCFRFKSYFTAGFKSFLQSSPFNGHLSTTATYFCTGGHSIHSLLFSSLFNGHLSTTETATKTLPSCQKWQVVQRLTNGEYKIRLFYC